MRVRLEQQQGSFPTVAVKLCLTGTAARLQGSVNVGLHIKHLFLAPLLSLQISQKLPKPRQLPRSYYLRKQKFPEKLNEKTNFFFFDS